MCLSVYAQNADTTGFNRFYYPNGQVSSEGYMKDGKPDGYWKSYYENGVLKSEGKRKYFLLDSVWNFYNNEGHLVEEISYRNDKKNGYTKTYDYYYNKDSVKIYYLKSKELYLNGQMEGVSYYYNKLGYLEFLYNYKNGIKDGEARQFNKDSIVIALLKYYKGYRIDLERVNRYDNQKKRHGKWIDFFSNGNIQYEYTYFKGVLHGIYREYDITGKKIAEKRYVNGKVFVPKTEDKIVLKAKVKKSYYPNGKIQFEGAFLKDMPVGIHKEYDANGNLSKVKEYTSQSILLGEGLFDENSKRTGVWRLYDEYWEYYYAKGSYKDGLRTGEWVYFYSDGSKEMEGYFNKDKPDREWIWYYKNGNKKRVENYLSGKLEGEYIEFDSAENVILQGEYFDDVRIGKWVYNVGDIIEEGNYELGEKDGNWTHYYSNTGKIRFTGYYKKGDPDKTHKWYYPNGNIEMFGDYRIGKKHKNWKKFNPDGSTYMTFTYLNDELIKIDGKKITNKRKK